MNICLQCPQPDAYKASREDAAEIFEGESFVSQALAHGSVEKLSAAAPVFRSSPNGSSAKLPLSHAKEGARPVDVSIDSNRITGMSFISSRKSFSPPFASSGRPFSPLLGTRLYCSVNYFPCGEYNYFKPVFCRKEFYISFSFA